MSLRRRMFLRSLPASVAVPALRFRRALRDPVRAQQALKRQIAAQQSQTAYGRHHGVRGPGDFHRLPIADYAMLQPWIDAQRAQEDRQICAEPVLFYERTSGSSGSSKYIPYTPSLRSSFSRMFASWAYDILRHAPKLQTGKLYMSVSPRLGPAEVTATGRPIGLDDDADYLDGWMQRLLRPFLCGPASTRFQSAAAFKHAVCAALLAERDLEVISIWNPTFLEVLLDHAERTADEYSLGSRQRALEAGDWQRVWPNLKLLSCWDQGAAAPMATRLRRRLPHAMLQGKGLLATEGAVTVPLIAAAGCVPLVDGTVIELLDGTRTLPLHAATAGRRYEIVISPLGGLPRYRIGDRVEVTHFYRRTPCLRFVGRAGGVSDLVGEKLQESFVQAAMDSALPPSDSVRTLVPLAGPPARYALLTDSDLPVDAARRLDAALCEAHHYGLARQLGQLGPIFIAHAKDAAALIAARESRRGLSWGDVKPRSLQLHAADETLEQSLMGMED